MLYVLLQSCLVSELKINESLEKGGVLSGKEYVCGGQYGPNTVIERSLSRFQISGFLSIWTMFPLQPPALGRKHKN